MEMIITRQLKGLKEEISHKGKITGAREFDMQIFFIKERFSIMMELLQKKEDEENMIYEWKLKKRVRWLIVQLFVRKLGNIFNVWIKTEDKFRETE